MCACTGYFKVHLNTCRPIYNCKGVSLTDENTAVINRHSTGVVGILQA